VALNDLFKPKWQHSDPSVRLDALQDVQDTDVLVTIATTDTDAKVQAKAVQLIDDPTALEGLSKSCSGEALKTAESKLYQHYRQQVLDGDFDKLDRIRDDRILADLAGEVSCPETRLRIVAAVGDETCLCRIAEGNAGKEAGCAAADKVSDEKLLRRLAKKGANSAIRKRAQSKVDAIEAVRNKPTDEALRRTKLQELVERARKLSESYSWDYGEAEFAEADTAWHEWDPDATDSGRAEFDAARKTFSQRRRDFEERQAAEMKEKAALQAVLTRRTELCEIIESAAETPNNDARQRVAEAVAAWPDAGELPEDEMDTFEHRFERAQRRFERQAEDAETKAAKRAEQLEALTAAVAEAEEIAKLDNLDTASKRMKALRKQHHPPKNTDDLEAELADYFARLETAADALRARVDEIQQQATAAHEANVAKLTELCEQAEALLESEDRKAAMADIKKLVQASKALARTKNDSERRLHRRFRNACDTFFDKQRENHESDDWERWANLSVKEELCCLMEALAGEEDLNKVAKQVKEYQTKWKGVGHVPREKSDEVWKRFKEAGDAAYGRCKVYFAERAEERQANLQMRNGLCEKAEKLADSTDWNATTDAFKELQKEWNEAGAVPHKEYEQVNSRFRAANDRFFNRRRAWFDERKRQRAKNVDAKKALIEQAEAMKDSVEWQSTARRYKQLQTEWKTVGPAPSHKEDEALWEQFRGSCDTFFTRLTAVKPENLAKKIALCEQVEALLTELADDARDAAAQQLMQLQKEWKAIGPVPQDEQQAIWDRFHKPCDGFFSGRREEAERYGQIKQALVEEAEELSGSSEWSETAARLKTLQRHWKEIGRAPQEEEKELYAAFRAACDRFFNNLGDRNTGLEKNLEKKQTLCSRLEFLAGIGDDSDNTSEDEPAISQSLADQLQMAFETNFATRSTNSGKSDWHSSLQEVRNIQAEWKNIGPVPGKAAKALNERYRQAADTFYDKRPGGPRKKLSDKEMAANLLDRRQLVEEVEKLAEVEDLASVARQIEGCSKRWRRIGSIKSAQEARALRDRFDSACDKVYDAVRASESKDQRKYG
jgi:hypothetical protein